MLQYKNATILYDQSENQERLLLKRKMSRNITCKTLLRVPATRYQIDARLKNNNTLSARLTRIVNDTVNISPNAPHAIKILFMSVDSGLMPIAETIPAQGPNCPAYSPVCGLK